MSQLAFAYTRMRNFKTEMDGAEEAYLKGWMVNNIHIFCWNLPPPSKFYMTTT
jgi:hypothetical protein